MNGPQERQRLPFVLTVNRRIGIARKLLNQNQEKSRRWVYGLFDGSNKCQYVGLTCNPVARRANHRCLKGRNLEFRIVRETDATNGPRIETQVIMAYQKRGLAQQNSQLGQFGIIWMLTKTYPQSMKRNRISTD